MNSKRVIFPFTAIVGQEEMKMALILNVIDPKIGGIIAIGDRGTGKTTRIRGVADLLPEIPIIKGDSFRLDPKDYLSRSLLTTNCSGVLDFFDQQVIFEKMSIIEETRKIINGNRKW